jgi:pimeloyl-ACP methyl ester carboxylesterase
VTERVVQANGIEIWTENFGDASHPTVLLIMGASAQGILWRDDMCEALVAGGRHVIRYDNRDTGQSSCFDFAEQPYALSDMARDAVAVLDAYGIDRAHAVGASMGGMIGQTVAIEHPGRLLSLTSVMSSPGGNPMTDAQAELPGPSPDVMELFSRSLENPPSSREERIQARMDMFRTLAGSLGGFDEKESYELFSREHDRARDWDAQNNHGLAIASSPDRREALSQIDVPTLVIHGTEDGILPYEHGVATAKLIPNAELLTIEGMGHDFPKPAAERILGAILRHTS